MTVHLLLYMRDGWSEPSMALFLERKKWAFSREEGPFAQVKKRPVFENSHNLWLHSFLSNWENEEPRERTEINTSQAVTWNRFLLFVESIPVAWQVQQFGGGSQNWKPCSYSFPPLSYPENPGYIESALWDRFSWWVVSKLWHANFIVPGQCSSFWLGMNHRIFQWKL